MPLRLLRVAAGIVFVVFGVGKFTRHEAEVDSFRTYGLPEPDAFVYAIGVLEIACGLMLIAGILVWVAALAMAGNMVGAIVVSGIGEGEVLPSLTLAPALLVAMLVLLRRELPRDALPRSRAGGPARRP
ncbi:MAG TPA: DoxX family protein [Thermoleophilaceae bacterium]|nr:DoxX family protein [Thermoleophilaceae bacterium]